MKDGYKLMGFHYEFTGSLYSAGQIPNCKVAQLKHLKPGDSLLVAGVGHGIEAIKAAHMGINVTAVDLSQTMLKHLRKKIDKENPSTPIRTVHSDVLKVNEPEQYDMVMANFFLNVFSEEKMVQILRHLTSLVKPGGYMVIGDFAMPKEGLLYKAAQNMYWYFAAILYWATADNAVHRIYNYPMLLEMLNFSVQDIQYFKIMGMKCYWSILAQKKA